jgi:Zn-dependent protease
MTPREESALERLRRLDAEAAARARDAAGGSEGGSPAPGAARRRGIVGGALAGVLLALAKGKALLLLLLTKGGLLLSALKLGKLGLTLGTMGLTLLAYVRFYTWSFALGLVVLILVHELGHGAAAMRMGLRVGAPIFVPGFGAFIALKEQPRSTWVESVVGFGGPLAGGLGGLFVLLVGPVWFARESPDFARALAHFTFLLNLFNLLPVWQLDGARITRPLTTRHWVTGLSALAVVTLLTASEEHAQGTHAEIVFALGILVLGGIQAALVRRRERGATRLVDQVLDPAKSYVDESAVTPAQRTAAAVAFFGWASFLIWAAANSVPAAL